MLIIGDVLAVVASIIFICASIWATIMASCLLFSNKVKHAQTSFETKPGVVFGVGFGTVLFISVLVTMLWVVPLTRVFSFTLFMVALSVALMGAGGLAKVLGNRISPLDPDVSSFKNMARGGGLMVALSLVPLVGWFFFTPLMIIMSLGAGTMSLFSRLQPQPLGDAQPNFDVRS
ncbi:MAG: hypothetical protein KF784_03955 [Fimbriimonadaceae bacterium]|nr:hypothetical protein [Fimbriimonadaceae bacterium]